MFSIYGKRGMILTIFSFPKEIVNANLYVQKAGGEK